MNVFDLRRQIVDDYADYIRSFIRVQDPRISQQVDDELEGGLLWPEPLIQLNPSFEPGEFIDELVAKNVLHKGCEEVFRKDKSDAEPHGKRLRLHRHQADAILCAQRSENYVLTTGTGSGKSLSYIVPIVDHVLRRGSGKGIQAIVVYPMNALANSQFNELTKFLKMGFPDGKGPVTFERYTGQESEDDKQRIITSPPDILLTNYVMLELILTRPAEKNLIEKAKGLRFLVFDELHTYRGRQGADVALLMRRVRDRLGAENLLCVGTSATLSSKGTQVQQREEVARVASQLFGTTVKAESVIGETLRRATKAVDLESKTFIQALTKRLESEKKSPDSEKDFVADPLATWIESTFGVRPDDDGKRLIRSRPRRIGGLDGAARDLHKLTGVALETCIAAIQESLLTGYRVRNTETGFPVFAFRLHQFISKGDTVYSSLESESDRHITFQAQKYVPGFDRKKRLLPLAFCRECGQEYYVVQKTYDTAKGAVTFEPRELLEKMEDGAGYLFISSRAPWPDSLEDQCKRLPEDWLEEKDGKTFVKDSRVDSVPINCRVNAGAVEDDVTGIQASFLPGSFRFCLSCGVSYNPRQRSEFGKLTALGSEGRSTATTILSLSAIRHLKRDGTLSDKAKKLLSFTDNRQDASLQAGHFNDFIEIGLLRSALFRACQSAPQGLTHEVLTEKVFEALHLPLFLYAVDPTVKYQAKADTEKALRDVLGYRIYRDLRRGWRVTSPNLEQSGLLEIAYNSLEEVCGDPDVWTKVPIPGTKDKTEPIHPVLATASKETRASLAKVLLDYMRRELCIKVDYLLDTAHERIRQQSSQKLRDPWAIDENERMERSSILFPRAGKTNDRFENTYLSARGGFGQYLGRPTTFPEWTQGKFKLDDKQTIIRHLLEALKVAGLVERVEEPRDDVPGYQVPASAFRWLAGDGSKVVLDPIRVPTPPKTGARSNEFFVAFYKAAALDAVGLQAREHTAQVPADKREERETRFRNGELPILYCSPTMELGVDISELNVVNLRNVPPTPANYAQRSGRAGRSGQPALVFAYCSTSSQHDQYFFKRPDNMVAGSVAPPRLDLANEELVKSHMHAIWLAETDQSLRATLKDLLDLSGADKNLPLLQSVRDTLSYAPAQERARKRGQNVLNSLQTELKSSDWFSPTWLDEVVIRAIDEFDAACRRWRTLYTSAVRQRDLQTAIINDVSRSWDDKQQAQRLRREAEAQIELLTEADTISQSDFYSYRYFASEGFLPGYNFPRLPLSAYLPGRPAKSLKGQRDNYLSRPRFLAISEFGPQAIVYHEGSRYLINRVILPVDDRGVITMTAKQCTTCGYLHPVEKGIGPDTCERCKAVLPQPISNLFRLQNVSTKRRDKINSDEEERLRLGFELRTAVRFEPKGTGIRAKTAEVLGEEKLAALTYGQAATIWRINLGWKRRKNKNEYGFWLDEERGYWGKNELDEDAKEDPMSSKRKRVIPYVENHRNCLLLHTETSFNVEFMASLQAALKNAIQVEYQLEENELAAEPLPTLAERRQLLLFEASEGGAGVLRRLTEDADALKAVAKRALQLLHFDPATGADLKRAEGAREDCEAACYDCLMSYTNQGDHDHLDRKLVKDFLLKLAGATVKVAPGALPRAEHLQNLLSLAGSELERKWLRHLDGQNLRLPSSAQRLFESLKTKPDFIYDEERAVVYVDGPPHDYPERAARDKAQEEALEDAGWLVIRFPHTDDWSVVLSRYPRIFGKGHS